MKSLTKIISEFKEKYSPILKNAVFDAMVRVAYLQECLKDVVPKANKENIGNLVFSSLLIPTTTITYSVPALASESINISEKINLEGIVSENINVMDYIKGERLEKPTMGPPIDNDLTKTTKKVNVSKNTVQRVR